MAKRILIDSNVFICLLRQKHDPVPLLWQWSRNNSAELFTCGMVKTEVLRGMKTPRAKERMAAFFNQMTSVPSYNSIWNTVTELAWQLDRHGHNLPAPDILIAVSAIRAGATVMTDDAHFNRIPELTIIPNPFN